MKTSAKVRIFLLHHSWPSIDIWRFGDRFLQIPDSFRPSPNASLPCLLPLPSCLQGQVAFAEEALLAWALPRDHTRDRSPQQPSLRPSRSWTGSLCLLAQFSSPALPKQEFSQFLPVPSVLGVLFPSSPLYSPTGVTECKWVSKGPEGQREGGDKPLASCLLGLPGSSWSWGLGTKLIIKVGCFCQTSAEG